jgi:hypothetical protein
VRLTVDGKTRVYNLTPAAFGRFLTKWANSRGLVVLDILDISEDKPAFSERAA